MPKGKYQRKQRVMQSDMLGAAPAAPESMPSTDDAAPAPDFEATVLALLGKMSESIQGLTARVDAVEADTGSHILPRTVEDYSAPGERSRMALDGDPDGVPRSQKIPTFSTGETVSEFVMNQYRPKYGTGSMVRVNLDVVPHGRMDGRTRGELKAEDGSPDGVGRVIDRTFLSKKGEWKYRVKFPPKSLPGSNGGITALYERELRSA